MLSNVELREKWINFFKDKGHLDVSNRSIVPDESDRSLLFINSGIAAIKNYFYGREIPPSTRLVSCQKVIRTGDIDAIGTSYRHHTYFEMLGNFSIGDYFKSEAIQWAWEFLTQELKLDKDRLYVTIYLEDKEAHSEWSRLIPKERIIPGNRETNFWDLGVGPCGPCTEIYYDRGAEFDPENRGLDLLRNDIENERYLEIWNIVFSEFLNVDGEIVPNPKKNIDTGAGLERLISVLEKTKSNFETSIFKPIISFFISEFGGASSDYFAVADYMRTSSLLLNEGIRFGNKGREFILRKIFRKSLSLLQSSRLNRNFFRRLVSIISSTLPYYIWNVDFISFCMHEEWKLYENSKKISDDLLQDIFVNYESVIPAEEIFRLVTQQGGDYLSIVEKIRRNSRIFSEEKYHALLDDHRKKSVNSTISSAFIKHHPQLLNLHVETDFDYDLPEIDSNVVCIFDGQFNRVDSLSGEGYLVLDKTVVFPISGGQDSDDGCVNGLPILSSLKAPNGQVLHKIEGNFKVGDTVNIRHDPEKRHKLEIHHTLEHIFFELLRREINPDISRYSGNKYADYFSIEVEVPLGIDKSSFDIFKLDEKLREVANSDLQVQTSFISFEQYKQMNLSQKFEELYARSKDRLRLVNIGDYSRELCVGTHVDNSREIKDCLIVSFRKKQANLYRFKLIGGEKTVANFLEDRMSSRSGFLSSLTSDTPKQKSSISKSDVENWVNKLLNFEGHLNFINETIPVDLAFPVFKLLGNRVRNQTIFLFFEDERGYRFFMVGDVGDVKGFIDDLKKDENYKGGGNKQFGSGFCSRIENFHETIRPLLANLS